MDKKTQGNSEKKKKVRKTSNSKQKAGNKEPEAEEISSPEAVRKSTRTKKPSRKIIETNSETRNRIKESAENDNEGESKRKSNETQKTRKKSRKESSESDTDTDTDGDIPALTSKDASQSSSFPDSLQNAESSMEDKREKRRCTLILDEKRQNIYYPTLGTTGQVLAMNGVPSIEGHTVDGGFVIKFEEGNERLAPAGIKTKMFRMKLYTPQFADSKVLIKKILQSHQNAGGTWLFLKDLDCGDKRANFGLFFHAMSEKYNQLQAEDRYEIDCAPNLGFYKKYFLVTQHTQYNLETMEKLRPDDCILVDNLSQGSIVFKMDDKVTMEESREAMSKVNTTLMEYFDERQLIVFRAAVEYAFISPYLRETQTLTSLPVVCAYGTNNSGKTERMNAYSSTCGVKGGRNKKSTTKAAVEMMCESSLTMVPLDDPPKLVFEDVIEHGYDASEVTKLKGGVAITMTIKRNTFATCKVAAFDQNYHTKLLFTPEQKIDRERLEAKRDLSSQVERIAVKLGPKAVLHNLSFCHAFAEEFENNQNKYIHDAVTVIPDELGDFSRWHSSHALLLLAVKHVLDKEPEWTVSYEDVLKYLREAYPPMIASLKVNGKKNSNPQGSQLVDITVPIQSILAFLSEQEQVKHWIRLTTTVTASKPILAMKNLLFERAGVPNFGSNLRASGYSVMTRSNARFLSPDSDEAYFKLGANPVGKFVSTSGTLVESELPCFKPIVELLQEQERKDGVTGDGRPVTDLTENREREVCTKCGNVGEQLLTCSKCQTTVYCSQKCQRRDWRRHVLNCAGNRSDSDSE